jgi:fatty-acyl-CoA synthase
MSTVASATGWPTFSAPGDVERIETVPLEERDLPTTTYQVLARAAGQWPDRVAISVMPDAARWAESVNITYAELLATTEKVAKALARRGVTPTTPVGIVAPNSLQLVPAMLGARAAGIAVPLNGSLSSENLAKLIDRSGVRHLIVSSPDLDEAIWAKVAELADGECLDHLYLLDPTEGTRITDIVLDGVTAEYLLDAAQAESQGFEDPRAPRSSRPTPTPTRSSTPG